MTVTLTVEDGTGKSDANAIMSLAWLKEYFDSRGVSYADYTDDELSAAIVRASAFLATAYQWQGIKVNQRAQTMPFPRTGVFDREGWNILQNEIPREVKAACAEIAIYEAANPGGMNPNVVLADKVTSEQIGPIRMEYANASSGADSSRPVLTIVSDLIDQFLDSNAGTFTLLRM
jgi:hypothetical protein